MNSIHDISDALKPPHIKYGNYIQHGMSEIQAETTVKK
jgi:hypothetical protein